MVVVTDCNTTYFYGYTRIRQQSSVLFHRCTHNKIDLILVYLRKQLGTILFINRTGCKPQGPWQCGSLQLIMQKCCFWLNSTTCLKMWWCLEWFRRVWEYYFLTSAKWSSITQRVESKRGLVRKMLKYFWPWNVGTIKYCVTVPTR